MQQDQSGLARRAAPVKTAHGLVRRIAAWIPDGVRATLDRVARKAGRAVVVGGAVRNAALGYDVPDWDLASPAPPEDVAGWFRKVVRAGEKHGTIMVLSSDGPVEVTTFRKEGAYLDGRRPSEVSFHHDLDEDLARRDFTINAMAVDLGVRELADPFGGWEDLHARCVRCVGDPAERFAEDGLRPLRAVRFSGVLGFRIHAATRKALTGALETFERVAWERKREEMVRLLGRSVAPSHALKILQTSGMLELLASELQVDGGALRALDRAPIGRPWMRLAVWAVRSGCDEVAAGEICARWRASNHVRRDVSAWVRGVRLLGVSPPPEARDLRRWLSDVGPEHGVDAAWVAELAKGTRFEGFAARTRRVLATKPPLRISDLALNGHDLQKMGLRGRAVGRTLEGLLDAVLTRPGRNQPDTLRRMVHTLSTGRPHAAERESAAGGTS